MKLKLIIFSTLLLLLSACGSDSDSFPNENIDLVVPSSAGGGNDRVIRSMQESFSQENLVDENMVVENKSGGGGEVGWEYIHQQKDGHTIGLDTSLLLTNELRDISSLSYDDLTPIATVVSEWMVLGVNAETGLENMDQVITQLKEDPKSLTLAFGPSLGGDHHLLFLQIAVEAGIDPSELNIIVYEGGGEVTNALLGGHVDVVTHGVSALADHYEAGTVNLVAVSSDERIEELPEVKTLKEQDMDIVYPHWRGIVGPPDMEDEEVEYWEDKISKMTESDSWKKFLENSGMNNFYKNSEDTKVFLKEQNENAKDLLDKANLND